MAFSVSLRQIEDAVGSNVADILVNVAGIPSEYIDGRHHPCIQCGGTDRFRVIDMTTGTCFCNQCFHRQNGNYLNAVMHFRKVNFRDALLLIADYLGLCSSSSSKKRPAASPNANRPTSKKKTQTARIQRKLIPIYSDDGSRIGMRIDCSMECGKKWVMLFHWNGFTYTPSQADLSPNSHVKKHTIYEYTTADGKPHHVVYRMDLKQGRKIPMQFHWDGEAYVSGAGDLDPVPFNAPALKTAERVFFVEGEKCAVALQWDLSRNPPEGEMPAVTCINCGCGAFHDSYCEWFRGKDLLIYPDNDEPGRKLARELVDKLAPIVKRIRVYRWPADRPEKWDIADEIMARYAKKDESKET